MKKLTILWIGIGALYWAIYITAVKSNINPSGSGLITLLCFMTASIIETIGGKNE